MADAVTPPKTCLVIDDSDIIRRIAGALLKGIGLETLEAPNGQEALERCAVKMPDAILVDWHMPVMNGLDFVQSLRLQPGGDKPYIVYCTSENDPIDIARAMSVGADDYILKPFEKDGLLARFSEL